MPLCPTLTNPMSILLVHYNDLKADLDYEMHRIVDFLHIDIPAALCPDVVERCTFDRMRAAADKVGNFDRILGGGAQSIPFQGTNGRWQGVLTEGEFQQYRQRADEQLSPEATHWFEHGSRGRE